MILQDPDWEIRRIFRDAAHVVFYRKKETEEVLKLKSFFEDYYRVTLITGENPVPECDLLCITPEESGISAGKWVWIEGSLKKISGNRIEGPMKETYIRLFLDSCSA
jgi:hypothetical protein